MEPNVIQWLILVCMEESDSQMTQPNSVQLSGKQMRSTEAPPLSLLLLKDQILTTWCKMQQHIFRGLWESAGTKTGCHNIMHDHCRLVTSAKVHKHWPFTVAQICLCVVPSASMTLNDMALICTVAFWLQGGQCLHPWGCV